MENWRPTIASRRKCLAFNWSLWCSFEPAMAW
jgi:hypothetical protein